MLTRPALGRAVLGVALVALAGQAQAQIRTNLMSDYLIIAMGPENERNGQPGVGTAFNMNNFEIGANKAPVPSPSSFGPGLLGNVPNIPLNARIVGSGVFTNGNVAITNPTGRYNLQDTGVYADLGIRTAAARTFADNGTQNSFYNDPNSFPNTFTFTGLTNPGSNNNTGGFGNVVNPNNAVQATRIDAPRYTGVTGNFNFGPLLTQVAQVRGAINALSATTVLNVPGGVINADRTITLAPGLNVIDVRTGGSDLVIQNCNLVIQGPRNAFAIFRLPRNINMLVSQANILAGNAGIGQNNVVFFTDRASNNQHFNFNNTVINGVAFWSLGLAGGEININNAQGCTHLVADKITLNDVRFHRCEFTFFCPADLNGDGVVDFDDLLEFLNRYNSEDPRADLNGDGVIDFNDLLEYLILYKPGC